MNWKFTGYPEVTVADTGNLRNDMNAAWQKATGQSTPEQLSSNEKWRRDREREDPTLVDDPEFHEEATSEIRGRWSAGDFD